VTHDVSEGDWFAVPLRTDGFAVGVVARAGRGGVLLGYFFGPRRQAQPGIDDVSHLRAEQAVLVGRFGHLGLTEGTWPLLGRARGWDRSTWPTPVFVRHDEMTGRTLHVRYDDSASRLISETPVSPGPADPAPQDGLMGAGFVEIRLTRLLEAAS
jgi:hypothetical protein